MYNDEIIRFVYTDGCSFQCHLTRCWMARPYSGRHWVDLMTKVITILNGPLVFCCNVLLAFCHSYCYNTLHLQCIPDHDLNGPNTDPSRNLCVCCLINFFSLVYFFLLNCIRRFLLQTRFIWNLFLVTLRHNHKVRTIVTLLIFFSISWNLWVYAKLVFDRHFAIYRAVESNFTIKSIFYKLFFISCPWNNKVPSDSNIMR